MALSNRSVPDASVIPVLAYPSVGRWTFSQSIADVDPADWGGTLVDDG